MSEKIRHFTDLRVWRESHRLFLSLLEDADRWPSKPHGRGSGVVGVLTEQLLRSTASISANIAEGFNRSRRKFVNSLDIALGEANETEKWLYKVRDAGLMPPDVSEERLRTVVDIEKMLASLKAKIAAREDAVRESSPDYELWQNEGG